MALKDEWKKTGKSLGVAFRDLGVNIGRSAKTTVDIVDDAIDRKDDQPNCESDQPKSTVFNDGSWRKTGKELGGAFVNVGKSIVKSVRVGVDKLDDATDEKNEADDADEKNDINETDAK